MFYLSGVHIRWIDTPGDKIRAQDDFNITYELILDDTFYDWAFTSGLFSHIASIS